MRSSKLSELAELSVARGSGFGLLAIICLMVGLAGYPAIALKTGGVAALIGAAILTVKAELSFSRSYKRTELWALLDKHERPRGDFAQQIIGGTLREAYFRYAIYYLFGGFACFATALLLQLVHIFLD